MHVIHAPRWRWWMAPALLGAAVLGAGGYYVLEGYSAAEAGVDQGDSVPSGPARVRVTVVTPRKGEMDRTTVQPGTVESFESVPLFAAVSGYLKEQHVDIGAKVKRGQVLAVVDVPALDKQEQRNQAAIEQARARVSQMEARVETAKADVQAAQAAVQRAEAARKSASASLRLRELVLERMRFLTVKDAIEAKIVDEKTAERDAALEAERAAQAAITAATAQVTAASAKVMQAQADVLEAKADVRVAQAELQKTQELQKYAVITAPFDGIVTQRSRFVGNFVRAPTEGGGEHVPLLTVERTDKFRVVVQVPDRDAPYADPGDPAIVEIDAIPEKTFDAVVARIAGSEDAQTRTMRVEIDLPNWQGKLRQGMYGRARITLARSNMLAVPSSSLVNRSEKGNKAFVYVVRQGKARLIPVQIGADTGLQIGIVEGLRPDDAVIAPPGAALSDGTPVTVATPRRRPAPGARR